MHLAVSEIPEEGITVHFQGEDASWEGLKDLVLEQPPHGEIFVERKGNDIRVKGHFGVALRLSCSRCLEDYRFPLDISFQYFLRSREREMEITKEKELLPEDMEYGYYEGDLIQLSGVIEEHVLLAMPMKSLCRPDCRGLCPQCGANRNKGMCPCPPGTAGSPFDMLKGFVT